LDLYLKCHFVITSRPFGYRTNPLRGVQVLRIEPYSGRQIEDFIYKWYLANQVKKSGHEDEGVRMAAEEASEDLIHRLGRRSALAALAVNPLLLTMIATVHSLKEHLPGHRVELYHDIFEVTLNRRSRHRWSISNLGTTQKILILQVLAYYMMRNNMRTIPVSTAVEVIKKGLQDVNSNLLGEKFLKSIENDSGLLMEIDNGTYQFAHMTFQEYLASVHICADAAALEPLLIENVGSPWWEETIRLYSAQADATRIVEKCLSIGSIQSLSLATDCLDEAVLVDLRIRDKLEAVLNEKMESLDREEWTIASKAKLASRLHWMVRLSEQLSIDSSLITNIEYQLFLDEMKQKGRNYYPDHWVTGRFPQDQGKLPVLGVRPMDAQDFCAWLTGGDSMGMMYHLPLLQEVEGHDLNGDVYWLRRVKTDTPVPHPHEHAAIPIAHDTVKDLLAKDFHRLYALISMLEWQSRPHVPMSVLLDRNPMPPRATSMAGGRVRGGIQSYSSTALDLQYEDRDREELEARIAIRLMRKYRDFMGFNMIQLSRFAHETMDRCDLPLNAYMDWFITDAKPFYYRTGFDLSTVYETALTNVGSGPLKANLDGDLKPMAAALNNSLRLLYERKWFDLGSEDGKGIYHQLRWFVRLSMSLLAHNMQAKKNRDHFIEGFREFLVDATILEERLADRLKPLEGIRLVKEEPLKI
jgi:hypothetical protein